MKTSPMLASSLVAAALVATALAQGKGGGARSADEGAGGPGGGAVPASVSVPTISDEQPRRAGNRVPMPEKPVAVPDHTPSRRAAPAARNQTTALHTINQTTFADRRQLIEKAELRLKSSRDALKELQANATAARADVRDDFKTALASVKAREKEFDDALKAADQSDKSTWAARSDALAKARQNHAEAMARLEAVLQAR